MAENPIGNALKISMVYEQDLRIQKSHSTSTLTHQPAHGDDVFAM